MATTGAGLTMSRVRRFAAVVVAGGLWSCVLTQTGQETELQPKPDAPPQEVAAYHLVEDGRQQLADGHTQVAMATFEKALGLAPSSPHANLALAEGNLQQGQFRAVLIYCDRVARLVGEDPAWRWRVSLLRAQAFEGMGDMARSATEFRRVLDAVPDNAEARAGLARVDAAQRVP